jgi:hypothetical protein
MELHWFDGITASMILIFIYGIVYTDATLFMQLNFMIKVIIALYLIYKFNDFRSTPERFTTLDKKICFSAGIYIFIFSFADIFDGYFKQINYMIKNLANKIMYN